MNSRFRIEISETAYADIREIFAYVARESPNAAKRLLELFGNMAESLETFPNRCPMIPESEPGDGDPRHLIQGSYRMIFTVEEGTVNILRIQHGARQLNVEDLKD